MASSHGSVKNFQMVFKNGFIIVGLPLKIIFENLPQFPRHEEAYP